MAADALQDFQCFYWCTDIRINFSAYRDFRKAPDAAAFEISSNVICFILLSPLLVSAKAVINTGPQNQFLIYKKPPPAKNHFVLCQGRVYFYTRGATLFCDCSHALQNTIIFLATNVCLHVQILRRFPAFPCTLRGPFADPLSVRLPPSRALCECASNVISTSSVSKYFIFSYGPYYSPILFCCQVIFFALFVQSPVFL